MSFFEAARKKHVFLWEGGGNRMEVETSDKICVFCLNEIKLILKLEMTNLVLPGIKTSFNLRAHVQQHIGSTGKWRTSNSPKVEEFVIGGEEGMELLPPTRENKLV